MAALQPDLLLEPFSKNVYQFPPDAVDAVAYVGALIRLMGFFNLLLGIFGLILFWRWRLSNEPWILRSVIGLSFFSYLGPVIFDNTVGTIGFFEILEHVIFFAIIVLGVLMLADKEDAIENE